MNGGELSGDVEIGRLLNKMPQVGPGAGSGTKNDPFGEPRINLIPRAAPGTIDRADRAIAELE